MAEEVTNTTATTTEASPATETKAASETATQQDTNNNAALSTEAIEKLIQSRVDKSNAELGKKIASLQKENETLKKEKMSAEEVKQYEMSEKEKTLAAKEKELLEKENRLFAIEAIKEIGLDDGSKLSLSLVDFVMADEQETITERVKAFNELVQGFVTAKVEEKYKAIGRTPTGAAQSTETTKQTSIAETLGKTKSEQTKKANDILNMYLGGKK